MAALGNDGDGAALWVGPVGVEVNAEVLKNGSSQVAGANAAASDVIAFAVGAADDAAVVESTAGHDHGHHPR
ncbi:uncharacterized protein METZ01_LOCUS280069, partial [marine metagenome]